MQAITKNEAALKQQHLRLVKNISGAWLAGRREIT